MAQEEGTVITEAFQFQFLIRKKGEIMQLDCFQLPVSENSVLFYEDKSWSLIASFVL